MKKEEVEQTIKKLKGLVKNRESTYAAMINQQAINALQSLQEKNEKLRRENENLRQQISWIAADELRPHRKALNPKE